MEKPGAREGVCIALGWRFAAVSAAAGPLSHRMDACPTTMQYSRAGARRRRVLASEAVGAEADSAASLPPESRSAAAVAAAAGRYADGAVDYRQPRITDLIPRRRLTLFLLAASLLSVLLGLENLYGYVFVLPYPGNRQALAALDLQRSGNIADWCASASMLVCAAASLLVFAVRRHRTDDYRGVYSFLDLAGRALLRL